MKDILKRDINALVPIYTKDGRNSTLIKLKDEDLLMEKSIKAVLGDICKYYHYDLKSSNRDYGAMIDIKKTPPIPFTKDLIFIAVKSRSPIGKDDGAFSYINIEKVKEVRDKKIYFRGDSSLLTMNSDKTIEKNIKLAKLLKGQASKRSSLVREEEAYYDICIEDEIDLKEELLAVYRKFHERKAKDF